MSELPPKWMQDQLDAASEEAKMQVTQIGIRHDVPIHVEPTMSESVEMMLRGVYRHLTGSGAISCVHLEGGPQPAWVFAHETPPVARCQQCHETAQSVLVGMGGECDVCGDEDASHAGIVADRLMVIQFRCCDECRATG